MPQLDTERAKFLRDLNYTSTMSINLALNRIPDCPAAFVVVPRPVSDGPTYIIFFGGIAYVLLVELRKLTFTPRAFWIGIAITFVLDLLIELPLLHFRLYTYFGYDDVPMSIGGFPLYWLFINTTGPILCAAILFAVPNYFTGWRAPLVLFLPLVTDTACSAAVGLPVYNALHTPGANDWLLWGGAIASCGNGLAILDGLARWIYSHTRSLADEAAPAVVTPIG